MGVSVEIWRARIGRFGGGHGGAPVTSSSNHALFGSCTATTVMCLALINMLLLIGCVEANPGPMQAQCPTCKETFHSVLNYAQHQAVHFLDKNHNFPCYACGEIFSSVTAFSVHHSRHHKETVGQVNVKSRAPDHFADALGVTYRCSEVTCQETFRTMKLLRRHVVQHLRNGYVIVCPIRPCVKKFTQVSTFQVHFTRHLNEMAVNVEEQDEISHSDGVLHEAEEDTGECDGISDEDDTSDDTNEVLDDRPTRDNVYPENRVRDMIVKFYLWLEGALLIPATKVQLISEKLALLCEISHHRMSVALRAELLKAGLDQVKSEQIADTVLKKDLLFATHQKGKDNVDVTTEYMRKKCYQQKCSVLNHEEIILGPNDTGKNRFAHFISVKETLQIMFSDSTVKRLVENSFKQSGTPGVYQDFTDGSTFTEHPVCGIMDSIQLILFQDAFEFYPLSPTAGSYKCVGFYFVLGNMHPHSRSKVDAVQLAFLVKEKDLKFFTPEVVLKKLMDELKDLAENGIDFNGRRLPVVMMHMCGDNLGQHYIGGFLENFTGQYSCRFCEASKSDIEKNASFTKPLRTPDDYNRVVSELDPEDPYDYKIGIRKESILNSIPFFHVSNPALPPCIAHDMFEGVAKKDYALFLKYFIEVKQWISFDTLNKRISNFKCLGRDSADSLVQLDPLLNKIRGHASEVWLFVRVFPFLLSDKIEDLDDPVWNMCLLFKSICEYVCAPKISEIQVVKLKQMISLYVETRAELFVQKLVPKHHYMCHYSELIAYFGPLIRLWTMRFESRHVFFKNVAKASNNFKNITKTLVSKYVLNFAYKMTGNMCPPSISFRPQDECQISDELLPEISNLIQDPSYQRVLKTVEVHGIKYEPGLYVMLGCSGRDLVVGEIVLVLYSGSDISFIVNTHKAVNTYQGFFTIKEKEHFSAVKFADLADYYPLSAYKYKSDLCLTLKHTNPSMDSV